MPRPRSRPPLGFASGFAFGGCCLLLRVASQCGFPLPAGAGVAANALIRADTSVPAAAFAKASVSCRTLRMHSTVTALGKKSCRGGR